MAKFETLTDDFAGPVFETHKWTSFTSAGTTFSQPGNWTIPFTTTTTNGYAGIGSQLTYDLTGSYVLMQVLNAGNQSLASLEVVPLELDKDASNNVFWYINTGSITAFKKVATVQSSVASTTYNSTTMQWFRIRELGGTTFFDYSADGITWTNFTSLLNPFVVTALTMAPSVGTFANEASGTSVVFARFNLPPPRVNVAIGNFRPGQTWVRRFAKAERHPFIYGGAYVPQVYSQPLTGALSFTGNLTKQTNKGPFSGVLSFTGSIKITTNKVLAGVLSFTGSFTRRIGKILSGALSFTGTLPRAIRKVMTASLSFTGSINRIVSRKFTATLSFTGNTFKRTAKTAFTAALSFTGSMTSSKLFLKSLSATLSFTGSIRRQTRKQLTGGLSFSGLIDMVINVSPILTVLKKFISIFFPQPPVISMTLVANQHLAISLPVPAGLSIALRKPAALSMTLALPDVGIGVSPNTIQLDLQVPGPITFTLFGN